MLITFVEYGKIQTKITSNTYVKHFFVFDISQKTREYTSFKSADKILKDLFYLNALNHMANYIYFSVKL